MTLEIEKRDMCYIENETDENSKEETVTESR